MTDADKLRVLATWFDNFDDWREATGKIAPGITDYREVQQDLRRIADALAASQPPSGDAPDLSTARCPYCGEAVLQASAAWGRHFTAVHGADVSQNLIASVWAVPRRLRTVANQEGGEPREENA